MGKHARHTKKAVFSDKLFRTADRLFASADAREKTPMKLVSGGFLSELAICAAALAMGAAIWLLHVSGGWRTAAYVLPLLAAGYPVFIAAIRSLMALAPLDPSVLVTAAGVICMVMGNCAEAVVLTAAYRLGLLLRDFVDSRVQSAVRSFGEQWPDKARVQRGEETETLSVGAVSRGDILLVLPGETVPLDGTVIEGMSTLELSPLIGSGEKRTAAPGSTVLSGSINLSEPLRIEVTGTQNDSAAYRIKDTVVSAASEGCSAVKRLKGLNRFFAPVMVVIALIVAFLPPLLLEETEVLWKARGLVLLIIALPSALTASVPSVYSGSLLTAAKNGIVFKHPAILETMARVRTVLFEKNGIITNGRYAVTETFPVGVTENRLLSVAAAAEESSAHPIAGALRAVAGRETADSSVTDFFETPGKGVSALVDGKLVYVGTAALLSDHGISCAVPNKPGTAIHVAVDGEYWGYFFVNDRVRDNAFDALEALRVQGISRMVMLTGDVKSSARPIASALNFDMVKFELTPAGKISAAEYLMATSHGNSRIAFVGSGTDDAPALQRADVGISFDTVRHFSAFECADLAIMSDDLKAVSRAMEISKQASRTFRRNTAVFAAVKLAEAAFGLLGIGGLWLPILGECALCAFTFFSAARVFTDGGGK